MPTRKPPPPVVRISDNDVPPLVAAPIAQGAVATLESCARLQARLTRAQVAFNHAAQALRSAAAVLRAESVAGLDPDALMAVAAATAVTRGDVARMVEHVCKTRARLMRQSASRVCNVPGCGRAIRAAGLCQTHYKHKRTTGTVRPIHARQPDRADTVRLSGLSVSFDCKEKVIRCARERELTVNAVVTDVLEDWAKMYRALHMPPPESGG